MTHPPDEQWMEYLYGEMDEESRAALEDHERGCRDCEAQLAAWRGAMRRLDAWRLPAQRARRPSLRPLAKWCAAAALLLAVGYGIGRASPLRSAQLRALRDQVEASLRPSLESSIGTSLRRELDASTAREMPMVRASLAAEVDRRFEQQAEQLLAASLLASRDHTVRLLAAFAQKCELERAADRQLLAQAFGDLDERYASQHTALRNDLGVLALVTEDELSRTEQGLAELLVRELPLTTVSQSPDRSEAPK